jgi:glucosamine--fructose-6-phosphate aminotransferase (isomerizing)
MKFLGYVVGDGHIGKRSLRIKDTRSEILYYYQKLSENIFGLKGRVVKLPDSAAWLLEINSNVLTKWLRRNTLKEEFIKRVSSLPEDELSSFLQGLYDAEGCISKKSNQIHIVMTNKEIMIRLPILLLRMGILSSLHTSPPNLKQRRVSESYRVSISNYESIKIFNEKIGFSAVDKQKDVDLILNKTKKSRLTFSWKWIPLKKSEIKNILKNDHIPGKIIKKFLSGEGFITKPQCEKFINEIKKYKRTNELTNLLESFLNGDSIFQEIKEIKEVPAKTEWLYDIEVEGTHNFFANGFLSHNSRWSTHGIPNERNAHPHWDCEKRIFLVHNGIIENYKELKNYLLGKGHNFSSETDTEVVPHLIEQFLKENGDFKKAFLNTLKTIEGTYAFAVIDKENPDKIYAARLSSPLVLGIGKEENFLASDPSAFIGTTKKVIYLNDGEVAEISKNKIKLSDAKDIYKP